MAPLRACLTASGPIKLGANCWLVAAKAGLQLILVGHPERPRIVLADDLVDLPDLRSALTVLAPSPIPDRRRGLVAGYGRISLTLDDPPPVRPPVGHSRRYPLGRE
jgi:hypothetical protein